MTLQEPYALDIALAFICTKGGLAIPLKLLYKTESKEDSSAQFKVKGNNLWFSNMWECCFN